MVTRRVNAPQPEPSRRRAATTPEGREKQLIGLAVDLAERQLRDGTASAQVISHYLKASSSRERLEQERLAMEVELLEAKRNSMAEASKIVELYEEATRAMRGYQGGRVDYEDEDYES